MKKVSFSLLELVEKMIFKQQVWVHKSLIILILLTLCIVSCGSYSSADKRAKALATCESIRASMAGYAADSPDNTYPPKINYWSTLVSICVANGANLKDTEKEQGITLLSYDPVLDEEYGGVGDYKFTFATNDVPDDFLGKIIEVSPGGITKKKK